ncbi:MAG: hypothetical protein O7D91_11810, partial [Planctomycetota bacterium]|nr:hypothetical protein [Planctomycetota bacterium]
AWFREAWAKTGKKLDMGKSCVRFKKLDDVALNVIGQVIRRVPVKKFIEFYESAIPAARRSAAKKSAQKRSPSTTAKTTTGKSRKKKKRAAKSARKISVRRET